MKMFGNKGGMVIQMWMFGKLFSFVNCHLESGAGKSEARCQMFAEALKNLSSQLGQNIELDSSADYNFILGDLNFRFKSTFSKHINLVLESKNLMKELDELTHEIYVNLRFPYYNEVKV